jgi:iron complex outermembrane recepter protein
MHKYLIAGLACVHSLTAWAGAADTLSEADYFSEQPVVLSASRLSQPVDRAPAAVTVITREMIEASGFRHLVDVLRLVPGMVVGWQGGNTAAASYLGLADGFPRSMQIMVDGRSVYSPSYGNTFWRGIPVTLDDVDRIEVVRGPNVANDGINSLFGTIHIFTRHSVETLGGMGEAAVGEEHYREVNLRYGAETDNGSWRLGLVGREDQRHGVAQDLASDLQLSFRGDYQLSNRDELMLQFGAAKGNWRGTNVGFVFSEDQDADFLGGFTNVEWRRSLGAAREWSLQLQHSFNDNEEDYPQFPPFDPTTGDFRVSSSGLRFSYLDNFEDDFRYSLALEYRNDQAWAPDLIADGATVRNHIYGLSGSLEWNPAPQWVVHAAAMVEHYRDILGTNVSPRVAVNWLPAEGHAFRMGAAHAVSGGVGLYANHADIKLSIGGEPFYQFVLGTQDLETEKNNSVEIGYLYSNPRHHLNLDLRLFNNHIYDMVDARRVGDITRYYFNEGSITQTGVEYQLRWAPQAGSWIMLSQAWVGADSANEKYEASVPEFTSALLASHRLAGIDASLGYYHIRDLRWRGAQQDSKYNRLDLRLAKSWKMSTGRLQGAFVVQSLLGREFESFDADQMPGYGEQVFDTRGYVSLKYEFR